MDGSLLPWLYTVALGVTRNHQRGADADHADDVARRVDAVESGIPAKPAPTDETLVGQRGNITLTVLTGQETMGYCLKAETYWAIGLSELSLGANWFTSTQAGRSGPAEENVRVLTGRAGPDVRRVRVDTADGEQVIATLDRQWVAAWWPTAAEATLVTTYDEAGHVLGTVVPQNR